jgi:hypothetical protein
VGITAENGLYSTSTTLNLGQLITMRVNVDDSIITIIDDTLKIADSSIVWTKLDTAVMDSIRFGGDAAGFFPDIDPHIDSLYSFSKIKGSAVENNYQSVIKDSSGLALNFDGDYFRIYNPVNYNWLSKNGSVSHSWGDFKIEVINDTIYFAVDSIIVMDGYIDAWGVSGGETLKIFNLVGDSQTFTLTTDSTRYYFDPIQFDAIDSFYIKCTGTDTLDNFVLSAPGKLTANKQGIHDLVNKTYNVILHNVYGDSSTDNTYVLRKLIKEAPDSSTFYFPKGIYVTDSMQIKNRKGLKFYSDESAVLKLQSSTSKGIFDINSCMNLTFQGLIFDGNRDNVSGAYKAVIELSESDSCKFLDIKILNSLAAGLEFNNCDYNKVKGFYSYNTYGNGIALGTSATVDTSSFNLISEFEISYTDSANGSQGIFTNTVRDSTFGYNTIEKGYIHHIGHVGIEGWSSNLIIDKVRIKYTGFGPSGTWYGSATSSAITIGTAPNSKVINCDLSYFDNAGVECSSSSTGSSRSIISNNYIHNFRDRGIIAGGSNTGHVIISDNEIDSCYSESQSTGTGIEAVGGKGLIDVHDNIVMRMGRHGIWVDGPNISVHHNILDFNDFAGQNGNVYGNAIELSSAGGQVPKNCSVSFNMIVGNDSTSSGYQVYGIDYGTQSIGQVLFNNISNCYVGIQTFGDSVQFVGNYFFNNTTGFSIDDIDITRNPAMYALNTFVECGKRWSATVHPDRYPQPDAGDFYFGNWGDGMDSERDFGDIIRLKRLTTMPDTTGWGSNPNTDGNTWRKSGSPDTLMIYDYENKSIGKILFQ